MELGQAYGMIMTAPPAARGKLAFDHLFKFSAAIRALETCGKPVATAIGGVALGGGCELAMGTHYRVLADTPKAVLGLPESLVGLLPGGGGTQRLPRLVGVAAALPVLLESGRLAGAAALAAGLVDAVVPPGEESAAAEAWVLSAPAPTQPWDRAGSADAPPDLAALRAQILQETLGHYPAPLAIIACLERGMPQAFDDAIRTEMEIFAALIQRPEPRDMIRTMFVAKAEYERQMKSGALPVHVARTVAALLPLWRAGGEALASAGFTPGHAMPDAAFDGLGYWFDSEPITAAKRAVRVLLADITRAARALAAELTPAEQRIADYAMVTQAGFPAYLGGPFCLLAHSKE
jgi:3-hydroxyacyl-CoA dehydrogenase/enoyl-CoA hydratase/3-hydroxybutyryl-CoA epimerase